VLDKLKIASYQFSIRTTEPLEVPEYKGSTLRGGFGAVFKQIGCARGSEICKGACGRKENCAYGYVFETPVPTNASVLRNLSDVPRPFVIEPPLERKTHYDVGESMDWRIVLIGNGIQHLPYFVLAFKMLGTVGIGKGRHKFTLETVEAIHPYTAVSKPIYSSQGDALRSENLSVGFDEIQEQARAFSSNQITLQFQTPTRIKHQEDYASRPEFHILIRAILRRVSSLYYFHCGEQWETDYRGIIAQAQEIKMTRSNVRWVDWERYSARQDKRIELGGFVGEASYEGNLEPFLPLLLVGQLVHVGKACVFGNGQYMMKPMVR
jgi:hypothetical protein